MLRLDAETIHANPPGAGLWIRHIVATAITVYVLAWLFAKMKINSSLDGTVTGLIIGFALFHLPVRLIIYMPGNLMAYHGLQEVMK